MGREVRKVPPNWSHPKDSSGSFIPLLCGSYSQDAAAFLEMANSKSLQEAVDYYGCPDRENYMPEWPESECTHFMMYEDTSEGTPISPAFATPEELARWLADTGASSFGSFTATYDQWLRVAKGGWAPSAVYSSQTGLISGVEAMTDE